MTRASSGAGLGRRPNNSLAGVAGSSGFASAGNGCGSSVPLVCALTASCARKATNAAARVFCFVVMRWHPPSPVTPDGCGRANPVSKPLSGAER
jgi:hypothetical protein